MSLSVLTENSKHRTIKSLTEDKAELKSEILFQTKTLPIDVRET